MQLGALLLEALHEFVVLCLGRSEFLSLGRDDLRHPVIRLHGSHPAAQPVRCRGCFLDHVGLELGHGDELGDLPHDGGFHVILIELVQRGEEPCVTQQLLRGDPVILHLAQTAGGVLDHLGFDSLEDAHRLHHEFHARWGFLHRLHLGDVRLGQRVERGERVVEHRYRHRELSLAIVLDRLGFLCAFRGVRLILRHDLAYLVRLFRLLRDDDENLLRLHLSLLEHGPELDQLHLHRLHLLLRRENLRETALVAVAKGAHLASLLRQQRLVRADELEVGGGGDVVVASEAGQELIRQSSNTDMEFHAHVEARRARLLRVHLHLGQELRRHGLQRVGGPLAEPIDGAAVNEGGELAKALAEGVAHRGHAEHEVEVLSAL